MRQLLAQAIHLGLQEGGLLCPFGHLRLGLVEFPAGLPERFRVRLPAHLELPPGQVLRTQAPKHFRLQRCDGVLGFRSTRLLAAHGRLAPLPGKPRRLGQTRPLTGHVFQISPESVLEPLVLGLDPLAPPVDLPPGLPARLQSQPLRRRTILPRLVQPRRKLRRLLAQPGALGGVLGLGGLGLRLGGLGQVQVGLGVGERRLAARERFYRRRSVALSEGVGLFQRAPQVRDLRLEESLSLFALLEPSLGLGERLVEFLFRGLGSEFCALPSEPRGLGLEHAPVTLDRRLHLLLE
mmetsp:Transcript_14099/g.33427  ORF Transcript_14099/g.33427 Transcript_14099/m.33427 type:complete len:294 (-) Transcript_14099:580-1461(-)